MGGFAFQIPEQIPEHLPKTESFLPSGARERCFLTPECLRFLSKHEASCDAIPDISNEEMRSKSKANGLAKALVCVQTVWFIAQCVTRRKHFHSPSSSQVLEQYPNILYSCTENSN